MCRRLERRSFKLVIHWKPILVRKWDLGGIGERGEPSDLGEDRKDE